MEVGRSTRTPEQVLEDGIAHQLDRWVREHGRFNPLVSFIAFDSRRIRLSHAQRLTTAVRELATLYASNPFTLVTFTLRASREVLTFEVRAQALYQLGQKHGRNPVNTDNL